MLLIRAQSPASILFILIYYIERFAMATVLVVDDSPVDRRLAGKLLERNSQLAVDYAAHGGEALRQMEQRMPDLVLTDLQMPNMDGLRLVETVRRLYPLVPVIIMTAHGSEDVAVKALMSGAAGFVPKGGLGGPWSIRSKRVDACRGRNAATIG